MCVCVCNFETFCRVLRAYDAVQSPFFDVGAIYDSTTLHNILLSTRVPRDSSLLCDRTITRPGIYIYASRRRRPFDVSSTRETTTTNRDRGREKKTSSSSSFWYKPKSFLLSHVLFKVFSYSSGVFVLICSACNPFSLNSSSRSEYTCRCLATCFMP